ncbi:MAG: TetR/AcrR family transcriptional regulator [Pseudomonadales bacterium]|uniref:Transcriptional regulator n=1 Tax=Oleiphilus messinensis TaxID=141451 RepID=A0A1Y0IE92_9GAMM|nr:TetR/AcrR family transcriptional regulator [Oleiphilus messinensis]ARU58499.1 transcriptional regulator [Oleiphilus messinensis]MCG8611305.1 TetR/AcrR family transcriptional regulator [Pseudomonadales bacterium]
MPNNPTRDQIVDAADVLFYENGYEHTSFSQIAKTVSISRGNFYYHFKTKDAILAAVIERRLENTRKMLEDWEQKGDSPETRIRCFIQILIQNQEKILRFGCPVGTLTTELSKLKHVNLTEASKVFTLFRVWLGRQFEALGFASRADYFAMQLLARSQGIATLASAFNDQQYIAQEVDSLNSWLSTAIARLSINESD